MAARKGRRRKKQSVLPIVLFILVCVFCFLCLLGLFGGIGSVVSGFLTGVFGLTAYALVLVVLVVGVSLRVGRTLSVKGSVLLRMIVCLLLVIIVLHTISTSSYITADSRDYGSYLSACYKNGTANAGGAVFGVFCYPLLRYVGSTVSVVVYCIVFVIFVMSFAYPSLRTYYKKRQRRRSNRPQRERRPQPQPMPRREQPTRELPTDADLQAIARSRKEKVGSVRLYVEPLFSKGDGELRIARKPLNYQDLKLNFFAPNRQEDKIGGFSVPTTHEDMNIGGLVDVEKAKTPEVGSSTIILPPFTEDNSGLRNSVNYQPIIAEDEEDEVPIERPSTDYRGFAGRVRGDVSHTTKSRTQQSDVRRERTTSVKPPPQKTYVKPQPLTNQNTQSADEMPENLTFGTFTYPYVKPDKSLLVEYRPRIGAASNVQDTVEYLENIFVEINLPSRVIKVTEGPSFIQYALELENISQLRTLSSGIEPQLEYYLGQEFRLIRSVPGIPKAFGIELKNPNPTTVGLKEMMNNKPQERAGSCVAAIGKAIDGERVFADLGDIVHMLVAGTTGSGKSVFISSFLVSLLCEYGPDMLRLVMVDPKVIELKSFNGLPHNLIKNAITEVPEAVKAVKWVEGEMRRRYDVFDNVRGCKKIQDYNRRMLELNAPTMPYLILVIDEFPTVFEDKKSGVDQYVRSIVQKGRAAGVLLLIAAQRPTTDAVSGSTKSQITTRVALKMQNAVDSRTILDQSGAQGLIGNGDMLVSLNTKSNEPIRLQSPFISAEEIDKIVTDIIENNPFEYDDSVEKAVMADSRKGSSSFAGDEHSDELTEEDMYLLKKSLAIVLRYNKASATMLQQRLKIGFPKASNLLMMMEDRGYVSPQDPNNPQKTRSVLITEEQYIQEFGEDDGWDN